MNASWPGTSATTADWFTSTPQLATVMWYCPGGDIAVEGAAQRRIADRGAVHPDLGHIEALGGNELPVEPDACLTRRDRRDRSRGRARSLGAAVRRQQQPAGGESQQPRATRQSNRSASVFSKPALAAASTAAVEGKTRDIGARFVRRHFPSIEGRPFIGEGVAAAHPFRVGHDLDVTPPGRDACPSWRPDQSLCRCSRRSLCNARERRCDRRRRPVAAAPTTAPFMPTAGRPLPA